MIDKVCKYCNGTKQINGIGHMKKKCSHCDVVVKPLQKRGRKKKEDIRKISGELDGE